jgi:hypothetical protein
MVKRIALLFLIQDVLVSNLSLDSVCPDRFFRAFHTNPGRSAFLEKLPVVRLLRNFSGFYGT